MKTEAEMMQVNSYQWLDSVLPSQLRAAAEAAPWPPPAALCTSAGGEVERRAHLDQARAIIQRAARRAREVDVLLLLLTIHLIWSRWSCCSTELRWCARACVSVSSVQEKNNSDIYVRDYRAAASIYIKMKQLLLLLWTRRSNFPGCCPGLDRSPSHHIVKLLHGQANNFKRLSVSILRTSSLYTTLYDLKSGPMNR